MRWSVNKAAREWNVDRRTLTKALEAEGFEAGIGATFHTQEICRSLFGDAEIQQVRIRKADAEIREIEALEKKEELVAMTAVQKVIGDIWLAYRQRLLSLPSEVCAKANPSDPAFANQALQEWADQALKMMRGEITAIDVKTQGKA